MLVQIAIFITVTETIFLIWYYRSKGKGVAPVDFLSNVAAGLCLMFALLSVLINSPLILTALLLFVSGVAHVVYMWRRWK
jgi:hypothetical protein